MTQEERRKIENFAIVQPLSSIDDPDMLAFMASLIQDHDHFREKLMTEPDRGKRAQKYESMRAHIRGFRPASLATYEIAETARGAGAQPIYQEKENVSKLWLPPSYVHEVRG